MCVRLRRKVFGAHFIARWRPLVSLLMMDSKRDFCAGLNLGILSTTLATQKYPTGTHLDLID